MTKAIEEALKKSYAQLLSSRVPGYVERRLRWSGGTVQAVELGSGSPLLLVHGGMGELLQWLPLMPTLARSYRVIAVDRPGQGLSDPFRYDDSVDLHEHAAQFLSGIVDELGFGRIAIVGNSMGGMWSTVFALRQPERVEHLILVGAPAGSSRWLPLPARMLRLPIVRRAIRGAISRGGIEPTRNAYGRMLVVHPERLESDLLEGWDLSARRNIESSLGLFECALTALGSLKAQWVLGDRWRQLSVPVTFVWGEKDMFDTPQHGEKLAALIPGARVLRVPDAGHIPWLDDPATVASHVLSALPVPARSVA